MLGKGIRVLYDEAIAFLVPKYGLSILVVIYDLIGLIQEVGYLCELLWLVDRLRDGFFEWFVGVV